MHNPMESCCLNDETCIDIVMHRNLNNIQANVGAATTSEHFKLDRMKNIFDRNSKLIKKNTNYCNESEGEVDDTHEEYTRSD